MADSSSRLSRFNLPSSRRVANDVIRDTVCVSSAATRASYALFGRSRARRATPSDRDVHHPWSRTAPSSTPSLRDARRESPSTDPAAARRTRRRWSRRLTDHGAFREIKRLDRTLSVVLGPERVLRAAHLSHGVFETLTRRARGVRRRARLAQRLPQRFQSGGILTLSNHRHLDGFDPRQRRVEFLHCGASRCRIFVRVTNRAVNIFLGRRHRVSHLVRLLVIGRRFAVITAEDALSDPRRERDAFEKISLRPSCFSSSSSSEPLLASIPSAAVMPNSPRSLPRPRFDSEPRTTSPTQWIAAYAPTACPLKPTALRFELEFLPKPPVISRFRR